MPITEDILNHKIIGREFKRGLETGMETGILEGERAILSRLIEKRFGPVPAWLTEALKAKPASELEAIGLRLFDATSMEDLLG